MFTLDWLDHELAGALYAPVDVQRTLQALTCHSIARQLPVLEPDATGALFICGGGAHNAPCWRASPPCCPAGAWPAPPSFGLAPDWVEGAAFAWLAMRFLSSASPATCPR